MATQISFYLMGHCHDSEVPGHLKPGIFFEVNVPVVIAYTRSVVGSTVSETFYINGYAISNSSSSISGSTGNYSIGGTYDGSSLSFPCPIDMAQILIDNVALSQPNLQNDIAYFQKRFQPQLPQIICFGDSRTFGTDSSGFPGSGNPTVNNYPHQLAVAHPNWYVENYGHPGAQVASLVPTGTGQFSQANLIYSRRNLFAPFWVAVIWMGVNDYWISDADAITTATLFQTVVEDIERV